MTTKAIPYHPARLARETPISPFNGSSPRMSLAVGDCPVIDLRAASSGAKMAAMPKVWGLSKQQANYRPAPTPEVRCRACKFMFPPLDRGGCRYVRGVIEGSATCDEFVSRRRQDRPPA